MPISTLLLSKWEQWIGMPPFIKMHKNKIILKNLKIKPIGDNFKKSEKHNKDIKIEIKNVTLDEVLF